MIGNIVNWGHIAGWFDIVATGTCYMCMENVWLLYLEREDDSMIKLLSFNVEISRGLGY
jgi:hypothetical protein